MLRRALIGAFAVAIAASAGGASLGQPKMAGPSTDPAAAPAGEYALDPLHASVVARIKHLGLSNFAIRFDTLEASYSFDPAHPTASKVTARVDANSFDVGNQRYQDMALNEHFIKQRDILGMSKNPNVTFVSTSIRSTGGNRGTMSGDLTLNGVTKPVTFDVVFNGTAPGMGGGPQRMGFSAVTTLHRSDFQIAAMMPPPILSDEVTLQIEAEFTKKS